MERDNNPNRHDKKVIGFDDILEIRSKSDVFETDWELEAP